MVVFQIQQAKSFIEVKKRAVRKQNVIPFPYLKYTNQYVKEIEPNFVQNLPSKLEAIEKNEERWRNSKQEARNEKKEERRKKQETRSEKKDERREKKDGRRSKEQEVSSKKEGERRRK